MAKLEKYERVVGSCVMEELYTLADCLKGRVIQNINSTALPDCYGKVSQGTSARAKVPLSSLCKGYPFIQLFVRRLCRK